jgi:hypothetical protein
MAVAVAVAVAVGEEQSREASFEPGCKVSVF